MKRAALSLVLVKSALILSSGCDYSADTRFKDFEKAKPASIKKAPADYKNQAGIKIASEIA
jgi:hypothetical protein